ncbi:hypothetical protein [uncultured Williamsia sp.]|uniref:hypothetical protein n=1 Tax=uncultured Williamsia sp. TaxID=259311 RepID=UPI0026181E5B|nr:hypothetical protein [uncultured Williamsia sp.]
MRTHNEWGSATTAGVAAVARRQMWEDYDERIDAGHALMISTENGDGVVLEGTPDELAALAQRITRAVARLT